MSEFHYNVLTSGGSHLFVLAVMSYKQTLIYYYHFVPSHHQNNSLVVQNTYMYVL